MSISASVTGAKITATVIGDAVSAAVSSGRVSAAVTGGIGPQGPAGESGETGGATTLSELTDVQITSVADGDVLRYSAAAGRWQDYAELNLVDGGNFAWLIAFASAGLQAVRLLSIC
jgi:hypothetical protein